mmetsp:Transcript_55591/g.180334  ORF Transcript_55591/g.180334 Transcript_55591/m.180334 type:complete len:321 (+) Transcript_55591:946-1908(+)
MSCGHGASSTVASSSSGRVGGRRGRGARVPRCRQQMHRHIRGGFKMHRQRRHLRGVAWIANLRHRQRRRRIRRRLADGARPRLRGAAASERLLGGDQHRGSATGPECCQQGCTHRTQSKHEREPDSHNACVSTSLHRRGARKQQWEATTDRSKGAEQQVPRGFQQLQGSNGPHSEGTLHRSNLHRVRRRVAATQEEQTYLERPQGRSTSADQEQRQGSDGGHGGGLDVDHGRRRPEAERQHPRHDDRKDEACNAPADFGLWKGRIRPSWHRPSPPILRRFPRPLRRVRGQVWVVGSSIGPSPPQLRVVPAAGFCTFDRLR